MPCKELSCCDEDDFPQTSSTDGNCPPGYHWNGTACARCQTHAAPTLSTVGNEIRVRYRMAVVPYQIQRRATPDGIWITLYTAIGFGLPFTEIYSDATAVVGVTYEYRLNEQLPDECDWVLGETAQIAMLCVTPDDPALTPTTGGMDVTFTEDVGFLWILYIRDPILGTTWIAMASGTGTGAPQVVSFTGLATHLYYFYIAVAPSTDCGYIGSGEVSATPL